MSKDYIIAPNHIRYELEEAERAVVAVNGILRGAPVEVCWMRGARRQMEIAEPLPSNGWSKTLMLSK